MKSVLALLLLILLSGCAANKYVIPDSGPIANLSYHIKGNSKSMEIFAFDSYECKKPSMISSVSNRNFDQQIKTAIRANMPFINSFRIHGLSKVEFVTTEFRPAENESYVLYLDTSKDTEVRILKVTPNGLEAETSIVKPKKVCQW
jgi:hypothetical protein